jgi:hypothetical protein
MGNYGPELVHPQNPDEGVWTELFPWHFPMILAFKEIGIPVKPLNDPQLPKTKTRLYFGSAPTRTVFTVMRGWFSSGVVL